MPILTLSLIIFLPLRLSNPFWISICVLWTCEQVSKGQTAWRLSSGETLSSVFPNHLACGWDMAGIPTAFLPQLASCNKDLGAYIRKDVSLWQVAWDEDIQLVRQRRPVVRSPVFWVWRSILNWSPSQIRVPLSPGSVLWCGSCCLNLFCFVWTTTYSLGHRAWNLFHIVTMEGAADFGGRKRL